MIQTVTGLIDASDVGLTLAHEHLFLDLTNQFRELDTPEKQLISRERVALSHREILCGNPYAMKDNLVLDDFDVCRSEMQPFIDAGGKTVIDCTSIGIKRNPVLLRRLAVETGLNIVAGCGFYTWDTHPEYVHDAPVEHLAEIIMEDLQEGIEDTGIKAGIIGEIGTSSPIHPDEKKVLKASAMVCLQTRVPIMVHTFPWGRDGIKAANILLAENVPPGKIVICHTDVKLDFEYMSELLKLGVIVELDDFGKGFKLDAGDDAFGLSAFATDVERVDSLLYLIKQGHLRQLLITCDICLKCLLHEYGGLGYDHILTNIVPKLEDNGLSRESIKTLLSENISQLFS